MLSHYSSNKASRPGTARTIGAIVLAAILASPAYPKPLTLDNGAPVGDNQNSQTAGPNGLTLLQDVHLIQKLQRFDRERVPERVVHARGTGAHGVFVASSDLSDLTRAKVFEKGAETLSRQFGQLQGQLDGGGCGLRTVRIPIRRLLCLLRSTNNSIFYGLLDD